MNIVWFLIIGALAGWLAGILTKGRGIGILGNMIVGVIGAVIGGHIFQFTGVSVGGDFVSTLVTGPYRRIGIADHHQPHPQGLTARICRRPRCRGRSQEAI